MSRGRRLVAVLMVLSAGVLHAQEIEPRPADEARLAAQGLVLDVIQAGSQYIAVGERGHVLRSSDGMEWTQARFVPVQATLVRAAFAGGRLWAVGHDSTIIHSRDLGQTWSLQHFEPEWEKPLLDVHFFDANNGIAIGAYGLLLRTSDAGRNWERFDMEELVVSESIDWEQAAAAIEEEDDLWDDFGFDDDDDFGYDDDDAFGFDDDDGFYDADMDFDRGCYEFMECHLNAISVLDDQRMMIAAERGYGFRSEDGGESWDAFRFPYPGSMFGLIHLGDDSLLAFGLRGHVQITHDFGDSWEVLESGLDSTLKGGSINADGEVLMVGGGAARLRFNPETGQFTLNEDRLGNAFVGVVFSDQGRTILAGEGGLTHE
ncbi:MAG: WD40/YVTN/BNR-like repeat-containing protein [Wenzhouxiangella sp.]